MSFRRKITVCYGFCFSIQNNILCTCIYIWFYKQNVLINLRTFILFFFKHYNVNHSKIKHFYWRIALWVAILIENSFKTFFFQTKLGISIYSIEAIIMFKFVVFYQLINHIVSWQDHILRNMYDFLNRPEKQ